MKKSIFISLLIVAMGVMMFIGCQKENSCKACKEYKFVYKPDNSYMWGNNIFGTVKDENIPQELKDHQNDTINICAEIKNMVEKDWNLYEIEKFKCVIIE